MIGITLLLGIAEPDHTWHAERVTLWLPDLPSDLDLEQDAVAAWSGANPNRDVVHLWRLEGDAENWDEASPFAARPQYMNPPTPADDEDLEVTHLRERRRRDTLDAPDDPDDQPF